MMIIRCFEGGRCRGVMPLCGRALLVGRFADNDIVVDDAGCAPLAARIVMRNAVAVLEVLQYGSTMVNGKKVRSKPLEVGDRITIGSTVLIIDESDCAGRHGEPAIAAPFTGETLSRFVDAVGRERDLRRLLQKIIDILFECIGGEEAFIFHLDGEGKPRIFVSSSGGEAHDRFSDTIVQTVLGSGEPLCVPNALSDKRFSGSQSIADLRLTSVLCCPIVVAGTVSGVIYLGSKKPGVSFSEKNLETLRFYALMAGMLIDHVAFIDQQNCTIRRFAELTADGEVVAGSPVMKKVLDQIATVADSRIPVLFEGETGTGKDLMAQLLHRRSNRSKGKFVVVNCSSLRGELLESELFGHRKGAFTGAICDHEGLFVVAGEGTLFLDEISEMDIALQAKLLRTLESNTVRPVGASTEVPVDVRIVCATNRDLKQMVDEGHFRRDLYYRINQFTIRLPPLRDRGEDIVLLAYFFLERFKVQYPTKRVTDFHPESLRALSCYDWPGNVRELAAAVHKGVLMASGPLVRLEIESEGGGEMNFVKATREFQRRLVQRALNACDGNKEAAARLLGMSRSSFFRYLSSNEREEV